MSDSLTNLILSLAPEDGSSIGNGAMMALLREHMPGLADDDYFAARDALVADGLLARGRGRGGSIMRVAGDTENEDEEEASDKDEDGDDEVDGFELTPTIEAAPRQRAAAGRKKAARKPDGPVQVLSYRHGETRVNNPDVGMVHAGTDPDGEKTTWAYAKNDHLGFQVYYMWAGSRRRYVPDFLVRLSGGTLLALEIKGTDSPQNKAKREALNEWLRAINASGGFGRWAWDVAFKPGDVQDIITRHAAITEPAE